jgi:hypothetical protein
MSGSNLPKAILSPPSSPEEKCEPLSLSSTIKLTRYYEIVRSNATQSLQDIHQNKIKTLRKELDYLKETLHYWHNILKDKFTKDYYDVMKALKWPFVNTNFSLLLLTVALLLI